MKLCSETKCLGCGACENICFKEAITMQENYHKSLIPVINAERCVDCGACQRVCPVINPVSKNSIRKSYAAWCKDKEIVRKSASSGIVTALSMLILSTGGVVFGTRYENRKLIFDYTENEEKIKDFQGSKYVQAYVGNAFKNVKRFLKEEREVLFVGTPCQIAGLKNYLKKDYSKLLTVDLICHGVAPASYLDEYLKKYEYDNVLFRGEKGLRTVAYKKNKIIFSKYKLADIFYAAYVKGLIHRENCYSCPFATTERIGDLTVGDFWGIKKENLQVDATKIPYISLVFTNTTKGEEIFKEVQKLVIAEERSVEETIEYNNQLHKPCVRHPERDVFLNVYERSNFKSAIKATSLYKQVKKQELKYSCLEILSKLKHTILKDH